MWFPYAAPFYVARIAEMRPALIVLAAVVAIGILVWKRPRNWELWIVGVILGAILLVLMSDRRRRRNPACSSKGITSLRRLHRLER